MDMNLTFLTCADWKWTIPAHVHKSYRFNFVIISQTAVDVVIIYVGVVQMFVPPI